MPLAAAALTSNAALAHPALRLPAARLPLAHLAARAQEGSEYHTLAARLKAIFEERYAKYVRDDGACRSSRAAAAVRSAAVVPGQP